MIVAIQLFDVITPPQLLILLAIALLTTTLMRRLARRQMIRQHEEKAPTPRISHHARDQISERAAADDLKVQLHELFREMSGRIDTKMHVLNELLIEANARIAELKRLVAAPRPVKPAEESAAPDSKPASGDEPFVVELDRAATAESKYSDIYSLSDQGLTAAQISDRLNQPMGEIELILGLYHRRRQRGA